MTFPKFAELVADSFQTMAASGEMFVVDIDGDTLYQAYLEAFPEGTNPIFKERTEHDCSTCKQFIRRVGNVVTINEHGDVVNTVWDAAAYKAPYPFNTVAAALSVMVNDAAINNLFRVSKNEGSFGARQTRSMNEAGDVLKWNHFYTDTIPNRFRLASPDEACGKYRTTVQVFQRGLEELHVSALETVLALIDANNLYRGAEHRPAVVAFQKAQQAYQQAEHKDIFLWTQAKGKAARFRNTVIGTLVQDLTEGMDVTKAVAVFEAKVAPHNYKRTKAVITPGMVKKAMETINKLGLEPALERRFARIDDIGINDVLWVDSSVKPLMKGGIGERLMKAAVNNKVPGIAEPITIDDFLADVLPEATGMSVLFKGEHLGNLMSLTAPVHDEPKQLFQWGNDFAWSYAGNIADSSIKERVRKAGGKVTDVALRVSLSWFNTDDLDIHVVEPCGDHIYFNRMHGRDGGHLDIDMNVRRPVRDAVENVVWAQVPNGQYKVFVNNYTYRESRDIGFTVEVECQGKLHHFHYAKEVRNKENVDVVTIVVKDGAIKNMLVVGSAITTNTVSQEKWNLTTEKFVTVNAVTLSPNHWGDNEVGNRHTFFVLDGAKNDEPTRGIYNEFLHPRLVEHRKVFEVIGDKTKCQPTEGQLSGLGFSSTKKDTVTVRVRQGKRRRLFEVQMGAKTQQRKGKKDEQANHQHV